MVKVIDRAVRAVNYVGMGVLFALMCFVTADVVARYVFNSPIMGGMEIDELALAVVALLSLSYTGVLKGHISIDILVKRLPARVQAALSIVTDSLGVAFLSLVAWQGIKAASYAKTRAETTDVLKIPTYLFKWFIPIGFILLSLVLIANIVKRSSGKEKTG